MHLQINKEPSSWEFWNCIIPTKNQYVCLFHTKKMVELYIFSSEKQKKNLINYADEFIHPSIHPGNHRSLSLATELKEMMIVLMNKTKQVLAATSRRRREQQHTLRKHLSFDKLPPNFQVSRLQAKQTISKERTATIYSSKRKAMYQGYLSHHSFRPKNTPSL